MKSSLKVHENVDRVRSGLVYYLYTQYLTIMYII